MVGDSRVQDHSQDYGKKRSILNRSEGSTSYNNYLLSTYYMPDPMLWTRNTMRIMECIVQRRDKNNEIIQLTISRVQGKSRVVHDTIRTYE